MLAQKTYLSNQKVFLILVIHEWVCYYVFMIKWCGASGRDIKIKIKKMLKSRIKSTF